MGLHFSTWINGSKLLSLVAILMAVSACSHAPAFNPQAESENRPLTTELREKSETEQLREQLAKMQDRVQDLETRLSALNEKINLENGVSTTNPANVAKTLPTEVVTAPAAHAKVVPVKPSPKKSEAKPEAGTPAFASNESVDRFREAKILFDSKKYSDAVLEFAEFVKNEPDHALAPAAQYYLGLSYLNQKEYKLAEEEFSRGLLSYAHSSYTLNNLLALAEVSAALKKPSKVTYYKEKILSHFPNSPQAKSLNSRAPPLAAPSEVNENAKEAKSDIEPSVVSLPTAPEAPKRPSLPSVVEEKAE